MAARKKVTVAEKVAADYTRITDPLTVSRLVVIECVLPHHVSADAEDSITRALEVLQEVGAAEVVEESVINGDWDSACKILWHRSSILSDRQNRGVER